MKELEGIANIGACIYTDGSADNIAKIYGQGSHGYLYDMDNEDSTTKNRPTPYLVTNIGYLEPNLAKSKEHKIVNPLVYVDSYGAYGTKGTNNVAEVLSIIEICYKLLELNVKDIIIHSDSTYAITTVVNSKKRTVEDIKNNVNVNVDLWLRAKSLHVELDAKEVTLFIDKIKGHSDHLGNDTADDLALLGRLESTKFLINGNDDEVHLLLSNPSGYWKPKIERHPFLAYKQIFFTINENKIDENGMEYRLLNYKEENEIGKKTHIASYGFIYLKEQDPIVEMVKYTFKKATAPHSIVSTVRLDNLYKPYNIKYLLRYGDKPLAFSNRNRKVLTVLEKEPIVNAVTPPALAYKAMADLEFLKAILVDYNKYINIPNHVTAKEFIDITDMYFIENDKGKNIIRPELTNNVSSIEYEYSKDDKIAKLILQFGKDIMSRNQIKRVEKLKPKIYLVVLNSNNVKLDYYTVVDLVATGDQAVFTNFYANTVLLK